MGSSNMEAVPDILFCGGVAMTAYGGDRGAGGVCRGGGAVAAQRLEAATAAGDTNGAVGGASRRVDGRGGGRYGDVATVGGVLGVGVTYAYLQKRECC